MRPPCSSSSSSASCCRPKRAPLRHPAAAGLRPLPPLAAAAAAPLLLLLLFAACAGGPLGVAADGAAPAAAAGAAARAAPDSSSSDLLMESVASFQAGAATAATATAVAATAAASAADTARDPSMGPLADDGAVAPAAAAADMDGAAGAAGAAGADGGGGGAFAARTQQQAAAAGTDTRVDTAAAAASATAASATAAAAPAGNRTANITTTQECVAYTASPGRPGDTSLTVRSADGSAVTSVLLVAEDLSALNGATHIADGRGPLGPVGAVEVRDVRLQHPRLGALVVSLLWLPYDEDAGALAAAAATSPRLLEELGGVAGDGNSTNTNSTSGASVVIKEARQGGTGSDLSGASFSDSAAGAMSYWAAVSNASANYTPATPLSSLGRLYRTPSRGRWALVVEDVRAGPNASRVAPVLLQWTLVLCPAQPPTPDAPPPAWLSRVMRNTHYTPANNSHRHQASQPASQPASQERLLPPPQQQAANPGAVGLLGGGSLGGGLGVGGVFGAGGGVFGAGGGGGAGGGPLLLRAASPAGTLVTVTSTTTIKPYSDVADAALASAVRGYSNFQTLFGLPYQPTPLINQWLPWVELLTGGTDLTVQNRVWPGKIVYYALQVELFVRTRQAMAANASVAASGGGAAGGGSNSGAGGSTGIPAGGAGTGTGTGTAAGGTGTATGAGTTNSAAGGSTGLPTSAAGGGAGGTGAGAGAGAGTGGTGTGTGGSGGGGGGNSGNNNNNNNSPNCGVVDGPNGPVVVNKKLLKRQLCGALMPPQFAQFAQPHCMDPDPQLYNQMMQQQQQQQAPPPPAAGAGAAASRAAAGEFLRSALGGGSSGSGSSSGLGQWAAQAAALLGPQLQLPGLTGQALLGGGGGSSSDGSSSGSDDGGYGGVSGLEPMDFGPSADSDGGSSSSDTEQGGAGSDGGSSSSSGDGSSQLQQQEDSWRTSPSSLQGLVKSAFDSMSLDSFNQALQASLQSAVDRAAATEQLLAAAAQSPDLLVGMTAANMTLRGSNNNNNNGGGGRGNNTTATQGGDVVKVAQALHAGAQTHTEVLKAAMQALPRMNRSDLVNATKAWLRSGGPAKEMKGMNKANGNKVFNNNPFVWNFQRVRLTFRFSPQDGFQFSFIQWLYNLADVNSIITVARALERLDATMAGRNKTRSDTMQEKDAAREQKFEAAHNKTNKTGGGGGLQGLQQRQQQQQQQQQGGGGRRGPLLQPAGGRLQGGLQELPITGHHHHHHHRSLQGSSAGDEHEEHEEEQQQTQQTPYDPAADPAQDPQQQQQQRPARRPGHMPTGERPQQWFDRVVAEAEALAVRALSRIPLADTIGRDRYEAAGGFGAGSSSSAA
ncbi:hypothetical protein HYH02_012348 [Chlamydomonas schloesseri]|uniref:Uncharacterized protein n=1 Tax=Chlamydomonas schloesseri TaxID=2026947 RepID=A0A835SZ06_9CHLO|nr:hypothetical protein HYH02_012348 [Chlamydomonas schloesseri]|eukprot:KAG2434326.1 hypothetical protein HYH02_012348 [Chlamydomonas schloesseri]